MSEARERPVRLLVITNETAEGDALFEQINELSRDRGAAVLVVAPALNGRLHHLMSDEDAAREAAEERLSNCLERLDDAGLYVRGWVGDANPLRAIDDALRQFSADAIVIATHPEQRSNWLAHNLVTKARRRFGVPVTHVVVDLAEHRSYVAA